MQAVLSSVCSGGGEQDIFPSTKQVLQILVCNGKDEYKMKNRKRRNLGTIIRQHYGNVITAQKTKSKQFFRVL